MCVKNVTEGTEILSWNIKEKSWANMYIWKASVESLYLNIFLINERIMNNDRYNRNNKNLNGSYIELMWITCTFPNSGN